MKINQISPKINFGKVIEIKQNITDDTARRDVIKVLNNQKTDSYTKEEAEQIKKFFRPLLGKDNYNIIYRFNGAKEYLISGQQAIDILAVENYADDVRRMKMPSTPSHSTDNSGYFNRLDYFKTLTAEFTYNKLRHIINSSIIFDKNPVKITFLKDDSSKFNHFEATQTHIDGKETTTTLKLSE